MLGERPYCAIQYNRGAAIGATRLARVANAQAQKCRAIVEKQKLCPRISRPERFTKVFVDELGQDQS
jgi:hypothetical protein